MVRITQIAPTALPSRRANTIQVMKMAQALVQAGHALQMIVPRPSDVAFREPDWQDLEQHYGLSTRFPIRWLPAARRWRSYDFGLRAVRAARQWDADLIYTRHPQAAAAAAWSGIPTLLEVHDLPQGTFGPLLFRLFLRGRSAVRIVSISHALLDDLRDIYNVPDRITTHVLPDGVDTARYVDLPTPETAREALSLASGFTAGYTGHLYPGRGVDHILAIAARLPDIQFLIAGGRPANVDAYRAMAAGLDNVQITGFIPNADLPQYQAACDVLLMPYQEQVSASSGGDISSYLSPMKMFEYLAAGRAILSSSLPVLREVLNEDNAVLLPPNDVPAWCAALEDLQLDVSRRRTLGKAARKTANAHTWRARAENLLAGLM